MTYIRALFIPDALRRAGLEVVEMPGWKTRGRPPSIGDFDPRAIMFHHDASARGPSPEQARFIAETGRPDEGIPAPLAQCWVDTDGVWHVLASGRSNHAGVGVGFGRIPRDSGNTFAIGVETDHTIGEKWVPGQLDAIKHGFAALADAMRIDPMTSVCGHKEYASGRKPDPRPMSMHRFRTEIGERMSSIRGKRKAEPRKRLPHTGTVVDLSHVRKAARVDPGAAQGHVTHKGDVLPLEKALAAEGMLADNFIDGSFGTLTIDAYRKWQRSLGFDGSDADGIPGLVSLTKLGEKHGFRVKR